MRIRVHILALGGVDLISSGGTMTMGVINTVTQFERDLLIECTQSGLDRAKSNGKTLGHPNALSAESQRKQIIQQIYDGQDSSMLVGNHYTH